MYELSEERIKNDEFEFHYYKYSSTELYICYRECIDKRVKMLMLEIAQFYEEQMQDVDPETVTVMLIEQYKAFWAAAEPTFQKFYEDIQKILALPKDFVPKAVTSPDYVYGDRLKLEKIEEEIDEMDFEYCRERFYIHALEQRKKIIEETCIPLKKQLDLAVKFLKDNMKKRENFDLINVKRIEKTNKFLEGFDKKAVWIGRHSEEKKKEIMKNFMTLIEENKNIFQGNE